MDELEFNRYADLLCWLDKHFRSRLQESSLQFLRYLELFFGFLLSWFLDKLSLCPVGMGRSLIFYEELELHESDSHIWVDEFDPV